MNDEQTTKIFNAKLTYIHLSFYFKTKFMYVYACIF